VIAIVHGPIDVAALTRSLQTEEDGAVVTFLGVSRRHSAGKAVLRLEYEAYEPMAATELERVVREARATFGVERIGVVHRLGLVPIGEASVAVVVASPHRDAAFKACRFVIDRLKETVPIWKREVLEDGARWVGEPSSPGCSS
jgi:molybdopterin synthase catalytic subunit